MTRTAVFVGPSLRADDQDHLDGFDVYGPAGRGDILTCLATRPTAIALIDGYFGQQPAVWHKEILVALESGVRIVGAASMGALRAAELARFGMMPVGQVSHWFLGGYLQDDDEVAILHGPSEVGYPAFSVALVDVRHTLTKMERSGAISAAVAAHVVGRMKETHYRERTHELAVQLLEECDPELGQLWEERFESLKRLDALLALSVVRDLKHAVPDPIVRTERSEMLWQLERSLPSSPGSPAVSEILRVLRQDPVRYRVIRDRAVIRGLASMLSDVHGDRATPNATQAAWADMSSAGVVSKLHALGLPADDLQRRLVDGGLDRLVNRAQVERWAIEELCLDGSIDELIAQALPQDPPVDWSEFWPEAIKTHERVAGWLDISDAELERIVRTDKISDS